ncbi:hypothetical protein StoSoilA2_21160 [Arthrobacter sp. StoSoilA2]|nr:hypothetical protein StoSoilA2_21160 [Arthrobacter sp. StoSoilA2]
MLSHGPNVSQGSYCHFKVLLGYFAGRSEQPPTEIVRSLETLANRAHHRLQAGWDETVVRRQRPYTFQVEIDQSNELATEKTQLLLRLIRSAPDGGPSRHSSRKH